jgi:hypothetical protein
MNVFTHQVKVSNQRDTKMNKLTTVKIQIKSPQQINSPV